MNTAKILTPCTNPECKWCKGTGKMKIDSPTDGRKMYANCYGDGSICDIHEEGENTACANPYYDQPAPVALPEQIGYTDEEIKTFTPLERKAWEVIEKYEPEGVVNVHGRGWRTHREDTILEMLCGFLQSNLSTPTGDAVAFARWIRMQDKYDYSVLKVYGWYDRTQPLPRKPISDEELYKHFRQQ